MSYSEHVRAEHLQESCWLAAAGFSALPVVFFLRWKRAGLAWRAEERNYKSRGVNHPSTKPNKTISMIQPTG